MTGYSHTDLMAKLLQHGPLSVIEARVITGWPAMHVIHTLHYLRKRHEVRRIHIDHESVYALTDLARVPPLND